MAHDVFISYSTKNATVAETVCTGLERRGIRCWMTPRDIQPGQDYPSAIIDAIDTCKVFVIIVSAASNLSDDVLRELQNAASKGVPILPFRIEDVKLSPGMRFYLGTPQWLDALTEPLGQHVVRLADTVSGLLGQAVRQDHAPAVMATGVPMEQGRPRRPTAAALGIRLRTMPRSTILAAVALLVIIGAYVAIHSAGEAESGDVPQAKPWEKPGREVGEEIVGTDGGVYVWVPSGSFMMGTEDGDDNEKPIHRVELGGFWLGKHEVTNAQYRAFCHATGREFPANSDQAQNYPVAWVSWDDARSYCDHYGLALPTEAQWEYAAAGPESSRYPWGDEWDSASVCYRENKGPGGTTFAVGSFPDGASWCGALDMAGNVWEWCADWYNADYYAKSPVENPPGPSSGDHWVLRGGSWSDDEWVFRCADRWCGGPEYRNVDSGFRCARIVP